MSRSAAGTSPARTTPPKVRKPERKPNSRRIGWYTTQTGRRALTPRQARRLRKKYWATATGSA